MFHFLLHSLCLPYVSQFWVCNGSNFCNFRFFSLYLICHLVPLYFFPFGSQFSLLFLSISFPQFLLPSLCLAFFQDFRISMAIIFASFSPLHCTTFHLSSFCCSHSVAKFPFFLTFAFDLIMSPFQSVCFTFFSDFTISMRIN